MTTELKVNKWLLVALGAVVIIAIGSVFYWKSKSAETTASTSPSPTLSAATSPKTSPTATDATANWKTYTNNAYGFSFKYPPSWNITEKEENFNDERKYIIELNFNNDSATNQSYVVEVFSSDKTARQFVDSYYGEIEGGPSNITEENINNIPVVKFFMEKAHIDGPAGSARISFKDNSTIVEISTSTRPGDINQSISDFWETISNDKILNQIASSFQFTK